MTKSQQIATRNLQNAQEEYLVAYGWQPVGRYWIHLKVNGGTVRHTVTDAMFVTRANLNIGW